MGNWGAEMRQSEKVRAVYRELRSAAGLSASAGEVLALAASLVELFSVDEGMPSYACIELFGSDDRIALSLARRAKRIAFRNDEEDGE